MAETMGSHRLQARYAALPPHHLADRRMPHRPWRGDEGQEHGPALDSGASFDHVRDHRLAHLDGKRHPFTAPSLAVHDQLARPPVQVIQPEPGHLAGAQSHPGQ